jgi:hypothetical protein
MLNVSLHAHYNDTTLDFIFQKHTAGNMPEQPTMRASNPTLDFKTICCLLLH